MANFVVELWESIFTPGTTPTLLLATNATFAALQTLLFVLLVFTHSIHFIVLSVISVGLWFSINWFARELAKHAAEEAEKKRLSEAAKEAAPAGPTDDSDTEVEGAAASGGRKKRVSKPIGGSSQVETEEQKQASELRRRVDAAEHASENKNEESSVSTEDEWEKVSEAENEKEK